jgi:hypothetical protein
MFYPVLTKHQLRVGIAAVAAACITLCTAKAEIKLADLAGDWQGSGTDRNSPLESPQQTTCQNKIRTEADQMTSDTVCKGRAGLNRRSRMTITLRGNDISGTLDQSTTGTSVQQLKGTIAGHRTGDTATLQIRFSAFMPNATVTLKLISASSYSVQGTALGVVMTDVTYNRMSGR